MKRPAPPFSRSDKLSYFFNENPERLHMIVTLGQYTIGTKDEEQENRRNPVKRIGRLLSERNSNHERIL